MAQIDTLTNVGAVVSTDLALILRGGANVLGTFGSLVGQNATSVTITGGTVNNTVIGGSTPAAGSFTTGAFSGEIAANGGIALGDGDVATFGAGDDLQIYHDGSNSYIDENGTGHLFVRSNGDGIYFRSSTNEEIAHFNVNGSVKLYHDNAEKLATTATGIDITGTAVTDGVTVDGNLSVDGGTIKLDGNYPVSTGNVALGDAALDSNVSGINNTAIGSVALSNNTASDNTALGYASLYNNTTGSNGVAIGRDALASNTSGNFNVGIGKNSLASNTTASGNTAVGFQAGYSNTTGGNSTYLGYIAGSAAITAGSNTILGAYAGRYTTSGLNTFVGTSSGELVTTGTSNTILGRYNGNQGGLDIRTANNHIVLSDGDGNPRLHIDSTGAAAFSGVVKANNLTTSGDSLYFLNDTNATATSYINFYGYQGGVTQFRNTVISNGKGSPILALDGDSKAATFSGNVGIGVTPSASSATTNIELPYGATLSARSNTTAPQFAMMSNAVGNWYEPTYKIDGFATQYLQQGNDGTHTWSTAASGTAGNAITFTPAMTLDASGNLLVGTTGTSSTVAGTVIYGGSLAGVITHTYAGRPLYINRLSTDGQIIEFAKDGTAAGSIGATGSNVVIGTGNTGLRFYDGGSAIIPHTAAGGSSNGLVDLGQGGFNEFRDLYLSGGVYLGGTGAANHLDDYEEGTWSPAASSDAHPAAYNFSIGYYTKIGRKVHVTGQFQIASMGNFAGAVVNISGLPFNIANITTYDPRGIVGIKNAATAKADIFLRGIANTNYMRLEANNGNTSSDRNCNADAFDTGTICYVDLTYFVA